tara:strand:+ start:1322 stop:2392 length:1071 start_codon:yes stop_codon:yes gene_type:complete
MNRKALKERMKQQAKQKTPSPSNSNSNNNNFENKILKNVYGIVTKPKPNPGYLTQNEVNKILNEVAPVQPLQIENKPDPERERLKNAIVNNFIFENQNEYNNQERLIIREVVKDLKIIRNLIDLMMQEIYFLLKKNNAGSAWRDPIVEMYTMIKKYKAKQFLNIKKSDSKLTKEEKLLIGKQSITVFKGNQSHIILSVIIYCFLISSKLYLPAPVLILLLNKSMKRNKQKMKQQPITMESFLKYKNTDYIKSQLKKKVESCYAIDDIEPFHFIRFPSNVLLGLDIDLIKQAEKLCRKITNLKEGISFNEDDSNEIKALACIAAVCHHNDIKVDNKTFNVKPTEFNRNLKIALINYI